MTAKNTRRNGQNRSRMARTEKELKAESANAGKKAKRVSLPVKVANFSFKKRFGKTPANIASESPAEDSTGKRKEYAGAEDAFLETAKPTSVHATGDFGEQVERQKRFIILAGVTFFMVVIAALWALGLGASLKASRAELGAQGAGQEGALDDIAGELGEELDKIKGELDNIQDIVPDQGFAKSDATVGVPPAATSSAAVNNGTSTAITPEVVERLKEKLK